MIKISKFVNFMRDYVFARSVIPIGIIVIAIGIYASTIYGDRKDYPRCEATVTDSKMEYKIRRAVPADEQRIRELFIEMLNAIYHTQDVKGYETGYLDKYWTQGKDTNLNSAILL